MDKSGAVIRLHAPKGARYRSLLTLPEVKVALTNLDDPTSMVTVVLKPAVAATRVREIAALFRAALDAGSGRVSVTDPGERTPPG